MSEPSTPFSGEVGPESNDLEILNLLQLLRRKEGSWVDWGQACQQLQKHGCSTQKIFEETGFEPVQQNQVVVAAQVYQSLVSGAASAAVQEHFQRKGSDVLYELRLLNQAERLTTAQFVLEKNLDADDAKELVRAVKDYSRLGSSVEGFSRHPGDAMAYQCWKAARQNSDLQARSRLIAKGLRMAHSPTARQKIEQLLSDFTVTPARPAPRLPLYRLETDTDMPRVVPLVGHHPITAADWQAVPPIVEEGPFNLVKFTGTGAWVPVPGWQVMMAAEDPIALLWNTSDLPQVPEGAPEEVLVIVDRAQQQWRDSSYFLVEQEAHLHLQWFEQEPATPLLGRLLLILRPKRILDENVTKELWMVDE